jgi:replicative DNA helicase
MNDTASALGQAPSLGSLTADDLWPPSPLKAGGGYAFDPLSAELEGWEHDMKGRPDAVPTGIASLDRALDGGLADELYVIAGLPGFGKTALALQVAYNASRRGNDVLLFSFELSRRKVISRLLSHIACAFDRDRRLTAAQAENGYQLGGVLADAYLRAKAAFTETCGRFFVFDGTEDITFTAAIIKDCVGHHIRETGNTPVVVVDKLQRIPRSEAAGESDLSQVEHASYTMSLIPKFHKAPTVVVSDLTKTGELKGSSNIAHDASVVGFLKLRGLDFNAKEQARSEALKASPREVDLIIDKNRVGECGTVRLDYAAQYHTFTGSARGW